MSANPEEREENWKKWLEMNVPPEGFSLVGFNHQCGAMTSISAGDILMKGWDISCSGCRYLLDCRRPGEMIALFARDIFTARNANIYESFGRITKIKKTDVGLVVELEIGVWVT